MKKWLKRLAIGMGVLLAVVAVLRVGFGLHVYMDGDFGLHLGWGRTSAHYDALEAQRTAQRAAPAAAAPAAPAPAAAPVTAAPAPIDATHPPDGPPRAPAAPGAAPMDAPSWTDFRGAARDGVYRQRPVAASWPAGGPRLLWKQPVGEGHASFVIVRGVAFTIEQRRAREVVAAYDVKTGRELWTTGWGTHFSERMGGDGPRATPTWHGGVVYALGAAGELRALRAASGETIWRTNILDDAGANNLQWAMAASPLVVDGKVIVEPGGSGASVVAYDAATGKPVWKALDDMPAYTSPMLVTLAGRRQIVTVLGRRAVGLAVDDGALLWSYPWETDNAINVAQPIVIGPSQIFLSSGYGKGAALVDIVASEGRVEARTVWANNRMKNKLSSSVLLDGFVYGLDEGILACVEAATGRLAWKGGRYGHGQLILAGDRLLISTETGELALVRATSSAFEEIARVPGIEGRTWNVPAIDDGILLVRNASEMAAFDVAADAAR